MDLAIACGSVFFGFSTFIGWLLWHVGHASPASPLAVFFPWTATTIKSKRVRSRLYIRLLRAGRRGAGWIVGIIAFKMLTLLVGGFLAWWGYKHGQSIRMLSSIGGGVAVVGWLLPEWWLSSRIGDRAREINRYLTDVLDLLVICLEAGLSFNASLVRVVNEIQWSSRVLSEELQYTNHEIQMGRPRSEALRNLGDRCNNEDFSGLLAIIIQAEKFGMSMAKTLRLQVEAMRQKRRQRVQQVIQTLPVKMVFPLVFCIFPELMVILLGPAAINIWKNFITSPGR